LEELLFTTIAVLVGVPALWALVYWTYKARSDRSAFVGLYLLLGIPGTLLLVAGAANVAFGRTVGWALLGFSLALALPLVKQFRFLLARFTPLNPLSPTEMVGLAFVLLVFIAGIIQLLSEPTPQTEDVLLAVVVVTGIGEVAVAAAGAGIWIYRSPRQVIDRLGLTRPTWKIVAVAFGIFILGLVLNAIAFQLTNQFQPDVIDEYEKVIEQTASDSQGPLAALIFGLSAGVGEELVFRGLIQPRFGIVFTAMLFTVTHVQYGITFIILGIFGIGLLLGWERKRFGTTACIFTHTMVNTLAALAS
jgi:membrane protease YdiL (CAAX protease family)